MNRPTWDDYFIGLAYLASARSHDEQTKVGCVIVNDKKIVSVGYNGFCSDVNDENLPTTRPFKYPYMVHAEENAVSNMLIKPPSAEAYITHMPCQGCAKLLWQNNIRTWHVPDGGMVESHSNEDHVVYSHLFENGLEITLLKPDLSYLNKIVERQKTIS